MTANTVMLNSLGCSIPYFVPESNLIVYGGSQQLGIAQDSSGATNTLKPFATLLAMINKANPDWNQIIAPPGFTLQGTIYPPDFSGPGPEMLAAGNNVPAIMTNVLDEGPALDHWWGSNDIAKYGVCRITNLTSYGPLNWINSRNQITIFPDVRANYVQVKAFTGVTMQVYRSSAISFPLIIWAPFSGAPQFFPFPSHGPLNNA